jgi:cyclopropane fatty-acyl-phospholipid synthase-like methyltransferase
MNIYWKKYYESNSRQFDGSLLKQVGKTVNGREVSELQIRIMVNTIAKVLQLCTKDSLVDLCCGNGLITKQLGSLVKNVVGVDFSAGLIDAAKRYNVFHNIEYVHSDILRLDRKYMRGLKKILMYEAMQHFSKKQLNNLFYELSNLTKGSLVLLGSIPDKEKLSDYYDTPEKLTFYMQRKSEGRPHIGRWWLMGEIKQIASLHDFKAIFLQQDSKLYTSYYRFDVLLRKCQ